MDFDPEDLHFVVKVTNIDLSRLIGFQKGKRDCLRKKQGGKGEKECLTDLWVDTV